MGKEIVPVNFDFNGSNISTIIDGGGDPWWIAKEVCDVLGLTNPTEALRSLDDDEKNTLRITEGIQGNPNKAIISESGLYSLILRSRKPEAKAFKKWITSEVLPTIRKTGAYAADEASRLKALNDPSSLRGLLLVYTEKVLELQPKADAFDKIANADGSVNGTEAAKALQVRPNDLFKWMSENKWIYRRPGGKQWLGYQDKVQQGLITHKVHTVLQPDGTDKIYERVLITPKGVTKMAALLKN